MKKAINIFVWFAFFISSFVTVKAEEKITVWAMGAEGREIAKMARKFEKQYPGIKVITQAIPWDAVHEKLITSVVGKVPPDVCQLGTTWMPEFITMDAIEPLDDYILKSKEISKKKYFEGSWSTVLINNKTYGIPWYVDTRVLFYRKDILKEIGFDHPPRTWEELEKIGKKLIIRDSKGKIKRFGITLHAGDDVSMFIWQNNGDLLKPNSPNSKEAIKYFVKLFDGKVAPIEEGVDINIFQAFKTGFYPMFISGPWMIEMVHKEIPEIDGKWFVSILPKKKTPTSFVGGCNLVIFKQSKNKELAWKFIEFMNRPEMQIEWYKLTTDLPSLKSVWDNPFFKDKPTLRVFRQQLEYTKSPPTIPEWQMIQEDVYRKRMDSIVRKEITFESGITAIEKDISEILSKKTKKTDIGGFFFKLLTFFIAIFLFWRSFIFFKKKKAPEIIIEEDIQPSLFSLKFWKKYYICYLFLFPALVILFVFLFLPVIFSFLMSMTNWDIYAISDWKNITFVGLDNYKLLFKDQIFWKSLFNTFYFVVVGVPLTIMVSLTLAVFLNEGLVKFKTFFRVSYFAPVVTTIVAVAVVWRWLYNPDYGLFNYFLQFIKIPQQNWLGNPKLALFSLIIMAIWKNFGYNMVIFLAGLQTIPDSLYESAKIDGANYWQCFRHITLPGLSSTMLFVTIMTTIGYFQFFAEPYVMTKGGPLYSTMSIVLYMYNNGFKFFRLGYASSIAYVLFGIIFIFSIIQLKLKKEAA